MCIFGSILGGNRNVETWYRFVWKSQGLDSEPRYCLFLASHPDLVSINRSQTDKRIHTDSQDTNPVWGQTQARRATTLRSMTTPRPMASPASRVSPVALRLSHCILSDRPTVGAHLRMLTPCFGTLFEINPPAYVPMVPLWGFVRGFKGTRGDFKGNHTENHMLFCGGVLSEKNNRNTPFGLYMTEDTEAFGCGTFFVLCQKYGFVAQWCTCSFFG